MSRRLLPLLILVAGIAGFVLLKMTRPEPAVVTATERSWRVEVQPLTPGTHRPVLSLYGEVVAPEQLTVTATLAGRIAQRPVREGQRVSAGDLLVALDEADIQPALAQAEAQLADLQAQIRSEQVRYSNDRKALVSELAIRDNARRQLERTRALVERNLASREALEAATDALARAELTVSTRQRAVDEHPARLQSLQARLTEAQASLDSTRRDARRARATAPFDGVVTGIQVAAGDQVSRNQPLLSVYPLQGLELRARVPGVFRAELLQALNSGIRLFAHSDDGAYRFELIRFAGTADPAGTDAILALQGDPDGLRPGGLLTVTLERPERPDTVTIPFSALYGADSVYLMDGQQRMQRVTVERLGEARSANGERQLVVAGEGLSAGALLITTHLPNAMTGLKVEPVAGSGEESR